MNKGIGKVYTTKRNTRNVGEGFVQGEDYVKTRNVGIGRFPSSELQSNRSEGNVIIDGESRFVKSKFVNDSPKPIPSFLAFSDYTTYPLNNLMVTVETNLSLVSPERVFCIKMDVAANARGAGDWRIVFSNDWFRIRYHYSYVPRRYCLGTDYRKDLKIKDSTPYYSRYMDGGNYYWINQQSFTTTADSAPISSYSWHPVRIIYQPSTRIFRNDYLETGEYMEFYDISADGYGDTLVSIRKGADSSSYKLAFRNIEIYDCDTYENALAI